MRENFMTNLNKKELRWKLESALGYFLGYLLALIWHLLLTCLIISQTLFICHIVRWRALQGDRNLATAGCLAEGFRGDSASRCLWRRLFQKRDANSFMSSTEDKRTRQQDDLETRWGRHSPASTVLADSVQNGAGSCLILSHRLRESGLKTFSTLTKPLIRLGSP